MATTKVSALTAKNTLGGSEEILINDGGTSKKSTVTAVRSTLLPLAGGTMTGNIVSGDNVKATYGAGADLQIYHTGTTSWIRDIGTGDLVIDTNGSNISLKGSGPTETMARFFKDGAVQLYYDNASKLATTSTGIDVTGTVTADAGGFGTTAPLSQLQVGGSTTVSADSKLIFGKSTAASEGYLPVIQQSSTGGASNDLVLAATSGTAAIRLYTGVSSGSGIFGTGSNVERFKIASNGDISFYEDTGTTPKLFWDASAESLGIGTASPSDFNSSANNLVVGTGTGDNGISIYSETSATSGLYFADGTGVNSSKTGSIKYNNSEESMQFYTNTSEKMRIDSSGNVGIGIVPSSYLTSGYVARLYGGSQTFLTFNNSTHTTQALGGLIIGNDASAAYIAQRENQPIIINTNNIERMRIDSSGRVGIGVAAPDTEFHVVGTGTVAKFEATDGPAYINLKDDDGTQGFMGLDAGSFVFQTSGSSYSNKLVITSVGNVGIGTTAPGYQLDLRRNDTGNTPSLGIRQLGTGDAAMAFRTTTSPYGFIIGVDGSDSDKFKIGTGGEDVAADTKLTIDTSGNVGIGTASPAVRLHIRDGDNSEADNIAKFTSNNGAAGINIGYQRIDQIGAIYPIAFSTGGSESLRIQAGGGISFNGDTAAANALDDYEEGTFTATLATGATTTPTATGKYTKIGDTAFVAFNNAFGSITVNGAALTISGLPFTSVGRTSGSFGNQARVQYVADAHHFCLVEASTTVVEYYSMVANSGGPVTLKTEASGTYTPAFNFQLVYKV